MPSSQVGQPGCFLLDALYQATATEAEDKVLKEQSHSVVDHESRDAHEGPTYLHRNPLCMTGQGNCLTYHMGGYQMGGRRRRGDVPQLWEVPSKVDSWLVAPKQRFKLLGKFFNDGKPPMCKLTGWRNVPAPVQEVVLCGQVRRGPELGASCPKL